MRVALVAALVLAGGCGTPFVAQRPYRAPDGQQLLGELRARQQALRAVDLETRTTSWLGGQRTRAGVLMLVERAGRLRFEAEVALQGTVATLVTDGASFAFLDLQNNVFRQGPACPENVAALIPVPLRPTEIASILLGDAPLSPSARAVGLAWDGKTAADVLEIEDAGAGSAVTRRLWISLRPGARGAAGHARWQVVGVEAAAPDGRGRWRVAYEDLAAVEDVPGGFSHPKVIRFAEPGKSFDDGVEIVIKQRLLNPSFKPQAFTLAPPAGYVIQNVACCPGCVAGEAPPAAAPPPPAPPPPPSKTAPKTSTKTGPKTSTKTSTKTAPAQK